MEEEDFRQAESSLNRRFKGKAAELENALKKYNSTVAAFFNNYGNMPVMDDATSWKKDGQTYYHIHYNNLSNKMDNSLLVARGINHKYIIVEGWK